MCVCRRGMRGGIFQKCVLYHQKLWPAQYDFASRRKIPKLVCTHGRPWEGASRGTFLPPWKVIVAPKPCSNDMMSKKNLPKTFIWTPMLIHTFEALLAVVAALRVVQSHFLHIIRPNACDGLEFAKPKTWSAFQHLC